MFDNETLRTILARRSIRHFEDRQISEEELACVIKAGQYAPSAMGEQQWLFVGIRNEKIMRELGRGAQAALGTDHDPYYGAPAGVVVFGQADGFEPVKDGSCAIATMGIAAKSIGLGSCWINAGKLFFPTAEGQAFLKKYAIPEGFCPVGTLILGYAAEQPEAEERRDGTVLLLH